MIRRKLGLRSGILATIAACAWVVTALVGCGGSGGSGSTTSRTGSATLAITWPEATRLIPVASNSITATFYNGTTVVGTQTVQRPETGNTTTVTVSNLPATRLTLRASAYPTEDGTGTAQASASTTVSVEADETTTVTLTMASTISTISVDPASASIAIGASATLVGTPLNANGATVLVSDATTSWSSSNTSVATVSAGGVVTGIANGTATITFKESESGVTGTATVSIGTGGGTGSVVELANAYIASLTTDQKAATVVSNNATNAAKWSNLPATPDEDGLNSLRNGVSYSSLTTAQKAAFTNLVQAALGTQGTAHFSQIRASDDYLGTQRSGYSGSYAYIGFLGTPSSSGNWMLQIGSHHYAMNLYFQGATRVTTTPYFLGVEPQTFTSNGTTYTPMADQKSAMAGMIASLTSTQLSAARLGSSFSDVYLGPGKDARSNFPTGTTGRGLLASNLTTAQKELVRAAIQAWTKDSPNGSEYQSLYESELDQTYLAYSGGTTLNNQGDYVRIDGPHVWIEFVCQNGVVVSGIHFHSVWRDRVSDYNAAYGF